MVNTGMIVRNANANAVASMRKGFGLTSIAGKTMVRVDFVKCVSGALRTGSTSSLGVMLGRSGRTLSRIMMMNCNMRHGDSLANSITSIGSSMLRDHPRTGLVRSLRKTIPKLGVDIANDGTRNSSAAAHVHNGGSVATSGGPLIVLSKVPFSNP